MRRENNNQMDNEMALEYQSVSSTICESSVRSNPIRSQLQNGTQVTERACNEYVLARVVCL